MEKIEEEEKTNSYSGLIDTFCETASASREEALFYLESHNYNLDSAVSTFLDSTAVHAMPSRRLSPTQSLSPSPSSSPSRSRSPSPPAASRSSAYNLRSRPPVPKPSGSRRGGIRTLSDLNRASVEGSDSDSDEPQEYYTGGEKSGMLVRDPSKSNDVDAIFNQATLSGAVEGPGNNVRPSSSSRNFTGTGRLLTGERVSSEPQPPESVTHNIVFWSNGFTVDDGPLRRLDDPANASFLESIRKSECPSELEPLDRRTAVHVSLTRKEENYHEPEGRHIPFQGVGRTLGSATTIADPEQRVTNTLTAASAPFMGLMVDEALPLTSIQLRLADGTRLVSRFNYSHTINDIRAFIDASRPGDPRNYQLQTVGFPPKQLTDLTRTIEDVGLANSVVIQKF